MKIGPPPFGGKHSPDLGHLLLQYTSNISPYLAVSLIYLLAFLLKIFIN